VVIHNIINSSRKFS